MSESKKFDQLKPILRPCHLFEGERNLVIESEDGQSQVVLAKGTQKVLALFDGNHSIQDISSSLYQTDGQVSFHAIITTLKLLNEVNLLDGVDGQFEKLADDKSPHEKKPSLLNRPIFELRITKRVSMNYNRDWLFFALAGALLSFIGLKFQIFANWDLATFLKTPSGYDQALLKLFGIASVLMSMKSLFQAGLLLASTGTFYGLYLKFYPYAIAFGINDNSIYSHPKKSVIVAYGFISAALYAVACGALSFIPAMGPHLSDLIIVGALLSFIDLNPYRRSDLTKLFHFFYAENQLKNIMPYLKNCSLTGIWKDSGAKLSDEIRYVAYSVLSLVWAVGFAMFSFETSLKSFPNLFFQIQLGQGANKYSAIVLTLILAFITGYLFIDLFHTVAKNIISPMLMPMLKLRRSSRDYKRDDVTFSVVRGMIKQHMLFNQLSSEAMDYLMSHASLKTMRKDENLILQGDTGRQVYFIAKGSVNVQVRESTGRTKHIVTLGAQAVLGEMAILDDVKRTAGVVAAEEIVYLEIPEKAFAGILSDEKFSADSIRLRNRIEISRFVSSANMFKDFPAEVMNLFVEAGDLAIFPKGHAVVEEGERDKTFYLLIRGKVDVTKNGEKINELSQGDFFGEVALIANVPRTATVTTTEECLFLYIEDRDFWKILSQNIELAMYVESVSRHRMVEVKAA